LDLTDRNTISDASSQGCREGWQGAFKNGEGTPAADETFNHYPVSI
jgi:hypothetical protein